MKIIKFFIPLALLVAVLAFAPLSVSAQVKGKVKVTTQKALPSPSPAPSPTPENVQPFNSFEVFWPISAGKVAGEPLYFLKTLKEDLREALIFSESKKADYNITLSEKRVVEVENLLISKKDYGNGKKTLDGAIIKRERAVNLINKVHEKGRNAVDLKNRMRSSLENQRALLEYITMTDMPEDQKSIIGEHVAKINSLLSSLE